MSKSISLYNHEKCPSCHNVFVTGFDSNNLRSCSYCNTVFVSSQKYDKNSLHTLHERERVFCNKVYNGEDNIYYSNGCPANMSDGRFITYYNSTNELTENMRKINGFQSHNQFRTFMQKYGDLFMKVEHDYIINKNNCSSLPSIACSEGWYNLWSKYGGNWLNSTQ